MKPKIVQFHREKDILTVLLSDGSLWERNMGDIAYQIHVDMDNGTTKTNKIIHSVWVRIETPEIKDPVDESTE